MNKSSKISRAIVNDLVSNAIDVPEGNGGGERMSQKKNAWRVNCHKFSKMYWRYGLKKLWKLKKNKYKKQHFQTCHTQIVGNQKERENPKNSQMKSIYIEILSGKENYSWLLIRHNGYQKSKYDILNMLREKIFHIRILYSLNTFFKSEKYSVKPKLRNFSLENLH